jgi:ABC-type multidrug transport system ATPase subunit
VQARSRGRGRPADGVRSTSEAPVSRGGSAAWTRDGGQASIGAVSALELSAVTKTYGPVRALVSVSCRFETGQITGVVGPNGSGKSTLLSIAGTLAKPTSGSIRYGDFGRSRGSLRAALGWLGHDTLCYPDLTGRQNIELAAALRGSLAAEAFASVAERFELGAFADRPFRTYSRGQRQRVALARALVHEPRLLLLDEPTTGLDAAAIGRLAAVLREEAARQVAVVLVTHDQTFADSVADRILCLERGRLVSERAPSLGRKD